MLNNNCKTVHIYRLLPIFVGPLCFELVASRRVVVSGPLANPMEYGDLNGPRYGYCA